MTVITVKGDPESVSSLLQSIISSGNDIDFVNLTKNNAEYIVGYSPSGPLNYFILLESGDYLLLESGDKIILES